MCRNIKTLFNFEPPATEDEIRASALQFVRKLSGLRPAVAGQRGRVQPRGRGGVGGGAAAAGLAAYQRAASATARSRREGARALAGEVRVKLIMGDRARCDTRDVVCTRGILINPRPTSPAD